MPLTRAQLQKVAIARRQLDLPEADYRALLGRLGVASSRELDNARLDVLLAWLRELGFRDTTPGARSQLGARDGMATNAQIACMRALWAEWLGRDDPKALDRWMERFGVSSVRFATRSIAAKATGALARMARRRAVVRPRERTQ